MINTYAKEKNAQIYFASDKMGSVSFPAFINSYSIEADYSVSLEKKASTSNIPSVSQGVTLFRYKVALDIPCASVSEAMTNYKNLQNLLDYIKHPNNPTSWRDYTSYTYVLLSNLIHNGLYTGPTSRTATSAASIKKYGAKCIINTMEFNPDVESGFFDYKDGKTGMFYPKAYTVSLDLLLIPNFVSKEQEKLSITAMNKQETNGKVVFADKDTKYWPFGIKVFSLNTSNDITRGKNGTDSSEKYAVEKGAMIGIAHKEYDYHTVFEAFLRDYNFKREAQIKPVTNENGQVTQFNIGSGLKDSTYSLNFDCVAHSVNEALTNLVKLQYLVRFPIKDKEKKLGGEVIVYFQNLISKKHRPAFGKRLTLDKIQKYGVMCAVTGFTVAVDNDMGYFDYKGFFLPKVLAVSLSLVITDPKAVNEPMGKSNPPKIRQKDPNTGRWK